jgi:hypothetical protein
MISILTTLISMRVHSGSIRFSSSTAIRSSSTLEILMVLSLLTELADGLISLTGPSRSLGLLGTPMAKSQVTLSVTKVSTFQLSMELATWLLSGNAKRLPSSS